MHSDRVEMSQFGVSASFVRACARLRGLIHFIGFACVTRIHTQQPNKIVSAFSVAFGLCFGSFVFFSAFCHVPACVVTKCIHFFTLFSSFVLNKLFSLYFFSKFSRKWTWHYKSSDLNDPNSGSPFLWFGNSQN